MTYYSVQPKYRKFVKGYGFWPFAQNIGENIDKTMSKKLSGKCSKNFLIMLKNL